MSGVPHRAVQWNRHKRVYDRVIAGFVVVFLSVFLAIGIARHRPPNDISLPILLMRGLGACALTMLHAALAIGPLARLDRRFAPLLYNRRHLGVATFLVALGHAVVALGFYGGFGVASPLGAVLIHPVRDGAVPFELLGFGGLLILFVLAATSHDYWLRALGPSVWKSIHMLVYAAYGLLVAHAAWGTLRSEGSAAGFALLAFGAAALGALHLGAGVAELRRDRAVRSPDAEDGWIDAGERERIPDGGARAMDLPCGARLALFRQGGSVFAVEDRCPHQGGPLSEGRIVDGCITCPWHGYQFDPATGRAPPPYTDAVATREVRVERGRVLVRVEGVRR